MQQSLDALGRIYLPSSTARNGQVPLSAIVQLEHAAAPLRSGITGQFPAATISFNLAPGASLGEAVQAIRDAESGIGICRQLHHRRSRAPRRAFQSSLGNEALLMLAAVVTVYIVLGVLYESFIHPITILSTLPSAGVGALLALMLLGDDLDVIAHHRHHAADRHRQEERDHDDRLRARRRARAKAAAARGDLSRRACCASGRS